MMQSAESRSWKLTAVLGVHHKDALSALPAHTILPAARSLKRTSSCNACERCKGMAYLISPCAFVSIPRRVTTVWRGVQTSDDCQVTAQRSNRDLLPGMTRELMRLGSLLALESRFLRYEQKPQRFWRMPA